VHLPLVAKRRAQVVIWDLQAKMKNLQRAAQPIQGRGAPSGTELVRNSKSVVNSVAIYVTVLTEGTGSDLRLIHDVIKRDNPDGKYVLLIGVVEQVVNTDGSPGAPKASILCAVGDAVQDKVEANKIVQIAAKEIQGTGGGKTQIAMGGGKDVHNIGKALGLGRDAILKSLL
jgi:alanyl-tRNA synthetase